VIPPPPAWDSEIPAKVIGTVRQIAREPTVLAAASVYSALTTPASPTPLECPAIIIEEIPLETIPSSAGVLTPADILPFASTTPANISTSPAIPAPPTKIVLGSPALIPSVRLAKPEMPALSTLIAHMVFIAK